MTILRGAAILALVLVGVGGAAIAGKKTTNKVVTITDFSGGSFLATGALGTARGTADTTQWIGCRTLAGSGWWMFYCWAVNSAGTSRHCWNDDINAPRLARVAETVNGDSYVEFRADTNGGRCTSVEVWNQSDFAPKQP
jgi:hypothetical protein